MTTGPFTGRRGTANADENGGRAPKFTPGDYYVVVQKGVYRESQRVNDAIYFGIETRVVKVLNGFSREENHPYAASRTPGSAASWVFNINRPSHLMYLPLGNMKNLANALMNTHGFVGRLRGDPDEPDSELADLIMLNELSEEGGELPEADKQRLGLEQPDPYDYVLNILVSEGGERLAGLPLRVEARDARDPQKANANLFCACTLTPVTEEEFVAHFGKHAKTAEPVNA